MEHQRLGLRSTYCNRVVAPFFPLHSVHQSTRERGLIAGRTTPPHCVTLQSSCRFHSRTMNSRRNPRSGRKREDAAMVAGWGGFLHMSKGPAPSCTDHVSQLGGSCHLDCYISPDLLNWQHGPGVNQISRLVCQKWNFKVYGPIWCP